MKPAAAMTFLVIASGATALAYGALPGIALFATLMFFLTVVSILAPSKT